MAEIAIQKSFEEKMKDRIKDSIGDLITDEQLSLMINRSMEEVFFKPTKVKSKQYPYAEEAGPVMLHELIKELLVPEMQVAVKGYIAEHKDEVLKQIDLIIRNGAGKIFMDAITNQMFMPLQSLKLNVESTFVQNGMTMNGMQRF